MFPPVVLPADIRHDAPSTVKKQVTKLGILDNGYPRVAYQQVPDQ